jgi:ankyrin repeat protein
LEFGADPDLCSGKHGELRPIHIAATNGNTEIIEDLIKSGVDIEAKDQRGWTALHRYDPSA